MPDDETCPKCGMTYDAYHDEVKSHFFKRLRSDATYCREKRYGSNKFKAWVHVET